MNAKISVFVICVEGLYVYYYITCMTVPLIQTNTNTTWN